MAIADNMPNDRPGDMARRIADLERAVRELRAARNLDQGTITPAAGMGIRTGDFDGTDFAHPGTTGNYFGGDGLVANSLYLRPGSVSNDALTNPVVPGQAFQGSGSFTLTVAGSNIITISKAAPAGFTSVVLNAYGRVAAINSTASDDALYCAVDVNGVGGGQFGMPVQAGSFGSLSAGYSTLITGLTTGAAVDTHLFASTSLAGWAANSANGADLSVTYLWLR